MARQRGERYQTPGDIDGPDGLTREARTVNAALVLRRPLMVTGAPGSGKSSLAYRIAYELELGAVLRWQVTSRTRLADGLYTYDAVARLQDAQLAGKSPPAGDYIRLGPLGTALCPHRRPRVVLIDEIDKGDFDLPNDLLNALDDGEFLIHQLARVRPARGKERSMEVLTSEGQRVRVHGGMVRCGQFPVIIMTSNGEREFPPAFLRRCVQLRITGHTEPKHLERVLRAQLSDASDEKAQEGIAEFAKLSETGQLPLDQLLSAVFLIKDIHDSDLREKLLGLAMHPIDRPQEQ
ncbi:MoxR family ATPase [Nonomuraea sp. PA05]|uniref:AAA family ATPase n=1 Tax=Nonomuraea sp. PA05 TaxID=2604466 RepID=UPI0011D9E2F9|nr:MoxR family ATPase [Nonomuraea sp. PA05]TYB61754.1 MoxR family ATPase [Nonomuraea sp. PA05]